MFRLRVYRVLVSGLLRVLFTLLVVEFCGGDKRARLGGL